MKCPRCQHENPPQAKFCLECGARVALTCTKCRSELPAGAKFCLECGEPVASQATAEPRFTSPESYTPKHLAKKILTSKSALEGERKQVTVLFADLEGSMELLADRDPEEARKITDPVLERMMEAVHRYEGTVNQVMGDGIMALFGAPLAHEDHAVRACYAALRMQESVKKYAEEVRRSHAVVIRIRVGLNSGEVVVRAIGSDLHMDYTAVGQITHLAARMEQLADPGTILLTPDTMALAESFVQVTALGPIAVKGLSASVEAYMLTGVSAVRSRLQAAATRGLSSFVGRGSEIDQLHRVLEHAGEGRGQVMAIGGEPGVGKSRLVFELTNSRRVEGWLVLEAGSVSYGKAVAYLPVVDLLKGYFGIDDRDTHQDIRGKITGKVLALDRDLGTITSAVLALLDVPVEDPQWLALEPGHRRRRMLDGLSRLLLRETQVQPVLLVVEDLHWIDSETQVFLDGLIERLPGARLLLLVTYRPEYRHEWGNRTYYAQVRLDALPPESVEALLDTFLGFDSSIRGLKNLLASRAEGNPLFLEESVRSLVETRALVGQRGAYQLAQPIEAVQMPATVQATLASRIDRLPPEQKRLLETAAVIGKDFPFALLQAITDETEEVLHLGLSHLHSAEFLHETAFLPELTYTFKHGLTHEVTYGTLLQDRRKALHARIVGVIERSYPDRLTEHVERLAYHALNGGLWPLALHYSRQSGSKAFERSANRETVAALEQALTALAHLPDDPEMLAAAIDVRLLMRSVLLQLGQLERTARYLKEAEVLALRLGDRQRLAWVWAYTTTALLFAGEPVPAMAVGEKARALADEVGDTGLRASARTPLAHACRERGDLRRSIAIFTEAIDLLTGDLARQRFGQAIPPAVYARGMAALCLAELGDFAEAERLGTEARVLTKAEDLPFGFAMAHMALCNIYLVQERVAEAMQILEPALEVIRVRGIPIPWATALRGYALALSGRPEEGCTVLAGGLEEADRLRFFFGHSQWVAWQAHAHLMAGRMDEAGEQADEALRLSRQRGQRGYEALALYVRGEIESLHERDSAETFCRQALGLADELGMRPLVAHCHLGLGKLYRRTGKREQAQEHLTTAKTMYREMGMTYWLEQAEAELRV